MKIFTNMKYIGFGEIYSNSNNPESAQSRARLQGPIERGRDRQTQTAKQTFGSPSSFISLCSLCFRGRTVALRQ